MKFKLLLISVLALMLCATMMPMTVAAQTEDTVGQIPIGTPIALLNDAGDLATSTAQQAGADISQPVTMATDTATQLIGEASGYQGDNAVPVGV